MYYINFSVVLKNLFHKKLKITRQDRRDSKSIFVSQLPTYTKKLSIKRIPTSKTLKKNSNEDYKLHILLKTIPECRIVCIIPFATTSVEILREY